MGRQDWRGYLISPRRSKTVLTQRQQEVLALMLERKTHREIAQALDLTTHTIQNHMVDIWDRLCEPRNRDYALRLLRRLCREAASKPALSSQPDKRE